MVKKMTTDTEKRIFNAKKQMTQNFAISLRLAAQEKAASVDMLTDEVIETGFKVAIATSGGSFALYEKHPPSVRDFEIIVELAKILILGDPKNQPYLKLELQNCVTNFAARSIASPEEKISNIFKKFKAKHGKKNKKWNELERDYEDLADEEIDEIDVS